MWISIVSLKCVTLQNHVKYIHGRIAFAMMLDQILCNKFDLAVLTLYGYFLLSVLNLTAFSERIWFNGEVLCKERGHAPCT